MPSYTEGHEPDLGDKGYRKWQTLLTWSVALHPVYRVLSESHNEWKGNATFQRVLWMACEGRASGRGLESAQWRLSEKIDSMTLLAPVEYIAHLVSECPPVPAKKKLTPHIDPAPCVFPLFLWFSSVEPLLLASSLSMFLLSSVAFLKLKFFLALLYLVVVRFWRFLPFIGIRFPQGSGVSRKSKVAGGVGGRSLPGTDVCPSFISLTVTKCWLFVLETW